MPTKTIHGNSQFQKPSSLRWKWESPDGEYHNEVDHNIASKRFCLTDVAVVPRDAIKEDLKERRADLLAEAAKVGRSITPTPVGTPPIAKQQWLLSGPQMDQLQHREGRWKREDRRVIPKVLPSEVRHAIMSVKNRTSAGLDRIKPEHLKYLPPVFINTQAKLFARDLSECKVPKQRKTNKIVLLYKKGDPQDIGNYRPICLLSVIYKLFTRVILNRIERTLDEGEPCDHVPKQEVSREYKMPLCLTFIDLKKAFDTAETEVVMETTKASLLHT
ncbi:hypothetical protein RB195_001151 [Necator americanus]|uniref:Reverse transcriptase domain-containing protein n=1 Tax=Necator americanus TaxID=51031 RepID=A0ABR1DCW9_NECAM